MHYWILCTALDVNDNNNNIIYNQIGDERVRKLFIELID